MDIDQQNISQIVKDKLNMIVSEMAENPSLFVVHPGKDFIRKTPLNFENTVQAVLQMGGQALNKELYDFMKLTGRTVSVSAFVQQRAKILPEAFDYMFHEFNDNTDYLDTQKYDGYKLYAVDGSDVCFATNPLSDTYMKSGNYNMYHMNAMYDILNHTYKDLIIEPKTKYSEPRSCWQMAGRSLRGEKCIIICDRGYGGVNLFEHINRCDNVEYLIRVKNNLFKEFRNLPMTEFDMDITFHLRTTQTNDDKIVFAKGDAKWIAGHTDKPYKIGKSKKAKTWDFESPFDLTVRVVRMKISDNGSVNDYYTVCTSLNRFKFPVEKIKELYHLIWDIMPISA